MSGATAAARQPKADRADQLDDLEDCALVEIVHLHRALRGELRDLEKEVDSLR